MRLRVFNSFKGSGFWSFAPFVIYGGKGCYGIGVLTIVFELQTESFLKEWEF
jgi:hypothetical protein